MRWITWLKWVGGVFAGLFLAAGGLFYTLLPPSLPVPPQSDIVISGVTVINPGMDRLSDRTVVVHDGRIVAVRPRVATDPTPICRGCYVIPGLIDAHVHTPPSIAIGNQRLFALLYLEYGVTSVRDLGQSDTSIHALADDLNAGRIVGPHMYRCGPVLDGDPPGWPAAWKVTTAAQGKAAVDELVKEGVDCIKVYNEVNVATYRAIAAEAARFKLPLIGHVPHRVGLTGMRNFEAQHLTGVSYLSRPPPPVGVDMLFEDILATTDEDIDHAIDVMAARHIAITPTLASPGLRLIASDPHRFPPTAASQVLPAFWGPMWGILANHPHGGAQIAVQIAAIPRMRTIVGRARTRGIDVLAGTDTLMPWVVPGEALLFEIDQLALAFGDKQAALAAATTVNARHVDPARIGMIAAGMRADILLLPSDPTRDLRALRRWKIEIADGRRYDRALVDGWLELYRDHFHGFIYSAVMDAVTALTIDHFNNSANKRA
ncbi:MAG TPA: amidohydrolase family protein [Rhizomicrobium sp.]